MVKLSNKNNDRLFRGWLAELEAAGKARGTIDVRASYVGRALGEINKPLARIKRADLIMWLADGKWGPSARRNARSSLVLFFTWAVEVGAIESNPAKGLPTISQPRAVPRPAPDAAVLEALGKADANTALAIEIMAMCGLRRGEVCKIRSSDVAPLGEGWAIRVRGKGGHERLVPMPGWLAAEVQERKGYIFPGGAGGHISAGWLGKKISRVLPAGYTPHMLRHRFGTAAYAARRDLFAVQRLLGHASVATTQVYVEATADGLRDSAVGAWSLAR